MGRVSLPHHVYLVTAVTRARHPVFLSFTAARIAIRGLYDPDIARRARTLSYVVMPDHLHWLMQLEGEGNLAEAVRAYKARVSLRLGQSVWQRGFHDRGLRPGDDIKAMARYLVGNPLRAGLVESIGDYPHWDAIWLQD
jgi:REP element-mobilizing transposase RayT